MKKNEEMNLKEEKRWKRQIWTSSMFSQWYQEFMTLNFVTNVFLKVDDGYCGPNVWPFYLLSHRRCKHRGIIKHTKGHGYKNHIRSAGLCNFTSILFGHKDKIEQEYTEKIIDLKRLGTGLQHINLSQYHAGLCLCFFCVFDLICLRKEKKTPLFKLWQVQNTSGACDEH